MAIEYLSQLLQQMRTLGASDMFLTTEKPPAFRVHGRITCNEDECLTREIIDELICAIMPGQDHQEFTELMEKNFGYVDPNMAGRFRVNAFQQQGGYALVFRAIPDQVPTPESLGLPAVSKRLAMLRRGLIVIVGAAGMGKSTTMASMLDYRNRNDCAHIITLEDPIEYLIPHKESVVNQREVGIDTHSYDIALRNALRQSPDVVAIGEIRDRTSLEHALNFADTGHLVLATLHAHGAAQALERIVNLFPENKREQILLSLATQVKAIISQQLVPTRERKLIAAFETLIPTAHISDLMRRGDLGSISFELEKSRSPETCSMDQSLYSLFKQGIITSDTALEYASSYANLRLSMRLRAEEKEWA